MPIISGGGGGGATPNLAAVLAVGNTAGRSIIVDGNASYYVQGTGTAGFDGGGAAAVRLGAETAGGSGGTLRVAGGESLGAGHSGGSVVVDGGRGLGANGGMVLVEGGGDVVAGVVYITTAGAEGSSGQALVSNGESGLAWGGVISAAGVPAGAPDGKIPFAYDTTPVTGGLYFWNGAAWIKVANIL